jgi:hypothetical protein
LRFKFFFNLIPKFADYFLAISASNIVVWKSEEFPERISSQHFIFMIPEFFSDSKFIILFEKKYNLISLKSL